MIKIILKKNSAKNEVFEDNILLKRDEHFLQINIRINA